MKTGESDIIKN